jgi:hypothetical protein
MSCSILPVPDTISSSIIGQIIGAKKSGCSAVQFFDPDNCAFGLPNYQKKSQLQKAESSMSSKIALTSASFERCQLEPLKPKISSVLLDDLSVKRQQ